MDLERADHANPISTWESLSSIARIESNFCVQICNPIPTYPHGLRAMIIAKTAKHLLFLHVCLQFAHVAVKLASTDAPTSRGFQSHGYQLLLLSVSMGDTSCHCCSRHLLIKKSPHWLWDLHLICISWSALIKIFNSSNCHFQLNYLLMFCLTPCLMYSG